MKVCFDAWLEGGEPRLRIVDSETGQVRLNWRYQRLAEDAAECADGAPTRHDCAARVALHKLVRELFLLSCADRLHSVSPASAALPSCVGCSACLDRS